MFNRLLSIDEDNKEVLDLIRGMHADLPSGKRFPRLIPVASAIVAGAVLATVSLWPEQAPPAPVLSVATDADADADEAETTDDDTPPAVVAQPPDTQVDSLATAAGVDLPGSPARRPTPAIQRVSTTPEAVKSKAGTVMVLVPGSWGDIYIDGDLQGRTGTVGAITVAAGTHDLVLKNDHALPYQKTFTVEPGEAKVIEIIDLQRKPVRFQLVNAPSADCKVHVDGIERGTIESLSQVIRVRSPEKPHQLTVNCPGGPTVIRDLSPAAPGSLVKVDVGTP